MRSEGGRWNLWDRPALPRRLSKEAVMDKEHVKGAADKAKGAVKDAAGKMMDDKGLQAEGKRDKAKGEARQGPRRPQGPRRAPHQQKAANPQKGKGAPPGPPFLRATL